MKSQIQDVECKFYFELLSALYSDVASAYPARIQTECRRDLLTICRRLHCEGLSFLTKTLPSVAKAIDTALASGTPLQVPAFKKRKGSNLPIFLGWLIEEVFSQDGSPKAVKLQTSVALKSLRQILYTFYKLELPYDQIVIDDFIKRFIATEKEMETFPSIAAPQKTMLRRARALIHRVLANADPRKIVPRHGPGGVSTGEENWEKPYFKRFIPALDAIYPYDTHFYFSPNHVSERATAYGFSDLEEYSGPMTAKVVLVPKDSRGPRLISMEPVENQWIQQGVKNVLVETIESHRLTRGHVNFSDQSINQKLALSSSVTGNLVTLDMKDASDRVSLALIHMLFPSNWVECMEACRSTHTVLPSGESLQLNKFAPMGSALCFPVEALVFWALTVATLMDHRHLPASQAAKLVWVYGDDIITTSEDYLVVMQNLESVGLLFNRSKCCIGTHFRESCGVDAYNGVLVTPLRIKRRWCHRSFPVQTHASYVAFSNALYERGLYVAANFLEKEIQRKWPTPYTESAPSAIQFVRPHQDIIQLNKSHRIRLRFCKRHHVLKAYSRMVRPVEKRVRTSYEELLAHYTKSPPKSTRRGTDEGSCDPSVFTQESYDRWMGTSQSMEAGLYSIPHRVTSKCGWTSVF